MYRGLVLICSSSQVYSDRQLIEICGEEQYKRILQVLGTKWFNVVKRGSAIAVGRITGSFAAEMWEGKQNDFEKNTFVQYKHGLHVHFYEDVTPIKPFPWRGQLGWKVLNQDEKQRIKIL